jgi:hypothetical protein
MPDSLEPSPRDRAAWGRWVTVVAGLFIMALVALLAVQAVQRKARLTATLPDGTVVQFLGSAAGTASFTTEQPWQRYAKRILPGNLRNWLPTTSAGGCSNSTNSVTFYFRITAPGGGPPAKQFWQNYGAEDDLGFAYPEEGGSCSFGGGPAGTVYGLILRSYPRRQREFTFNFLDAQSKKVLSLRLPNLVRGPFPEWQPEHLPVTHTNGPLIVTLESLAEHTNRNWRYVQPTWRLEVTDPLWRGAKPSYTEFEDSTGNAGSYSSFQEPAWKMKMPFRREKPEQFTPQEKFALTNLPVPAPGSLLSLDTTATRLGVQVKVLCLAGAGALSIINGTNRVMAPPVPGQSGGWSSTSSSGGTTTESWHSDRPFFFVEVQGLGANDELRPFLTAGDARPTRLENNGHQGSSGGWRRYLYRFDPPTNTATLSVEFIVNRAVEIEFNIDPAEIRRAALGAKSK